MPNRQAATSTSRLPGMSSCSEGGWQGILSPLQCVVGVPIRRNENLPRFHFLPPFLLPEFVMMRHALRCTAFVIFCALTNAGLNAAEPSLAPTAEQLEFFEAKIRPVLVKHCYECHSTKLAAPRGGLRLDDREAMLKGGDSGPIIVAGDLKKSPLLTALRYEEVEMPPKGKLPAAVIADFEQWVKMGAPDPRVAASAAKPTNPQPATLNQQSSAHWAFQKLTKTPPPNVKNTQWPHSDIDRFVLAKLEAAGLQPVAAADRRTLIRRASFDLIGLPPEPEQVAAFLNDPASDNDAFARVIDELLRSPHYGERWGRYWLDIARYGEDQAHTFKARSYPQGYLYRDWVVKAFNDNLPYDQFLIEQIAGDLVEHVSNELGEKHVGNVIHERPLHERIPALGLFALGPVYYQDNGEKDKALADEWDDRVDTLIRGTQALTISCARCHDHKFDPLTMADYYGLLGIFASTQYQERPAVPQEVVLAKQQADAALKEQQLEVDRYLATQARSVREKLIPEIPQYVVGAWRVMNPLKKKANEKKVVTDVAKQLKLNEDLLRRWVAYLEEKPDSGAVKSERPYLAGWRELRKQQDANADLSDDKAALAAVTAIGETLRQQAESLLPQRTALLQHFGEEVAFIAEADRTTVAPGIIPLGNLFDDAPGSQLSTALASDVFKATAKEGGLGVARIAQGWGHQTSIASGISFNSRSLGSDDAKHGDVVNDGWDISGGISTTGKRTPANLPRTEQGIGMHANALITFDLDEIRRAGLIPADHPLTFRVDRAGLNDDAFGSGSVHLAVIVSKPHSEKSEFDAILVASLNGQPAKVEKGDDAYYFAGELPPPLRGDGKFIEIEIKLPLDARYLTLVATGAGKAGEENSISSDHAVFSGARLEYEPTRSSGGSPEPVASITGEPPVLRDALLYSELFSDKGVLAIPSKDIASYLTGEPATHLASLNKTRDERKQAADAIKVLMAHAVSDGQGADMPVYLAGDPRKKGPLAPRSFPAILRNGDSTPFKPTGSGRLELARAIASPDNPLTARVFVNRIWAGHFGAGLVRTPSNFGTLGERPTHPELLDWLAVRFIESGWSMKSLHREIMLSATYRLSSSPSDISNFKSQISNPQATDADNHLLWRMNRRRLEVEPWRDSVLAVVGNLDRTLGGPSSNLSNGNNRRRTLYGFVSRHQLDDLLRLFDFPDPNITAGQRTVTTVPLQQLFVLNSEFMVAQSRTLAERLTREASTDDLRVHRAYALLFNRSPSPNELQLGLDFLATTKSDSAKLAVLEQYALALLGSNEFVFVD